jgi:hypothetical protein
MARVPEPAERLPISISKAALTGGFFSWHFIGQGVLGRQTLQSQFSCLYALPTDLIAHNVYYVKS